MHRLKITGIGNSLGLILPREVLARLKLAKGETVHITESPAGLAVTPCDPALEEKLKLGRAFMSEYRGTFHQRAQ